uniref:Protein kinase domain-containing protein n=1 Tax=Rhabditophanes sp. KR3021 TaxID=114890 RepID=A0AC35TX50_9BILA
MSSVQEEPEKTAVARVSEEAARIRAIYDDENLNSQERDEVLRQERINCTKEFKNPITGIAFADIYKIGQELSRGGFGVVYDASDLEDNQLFACKYVSRKNVTGWVDVEGGVTIPLEIKLLDKTAKIKGVINCTHWFEREDGYLIVMEKPTQCVDLFDYISVKGSVTEELAISFLKQVVQITQECIKNDVIHRDIKDENILIDRKDFSIKMIDFGAGAFLKQTPYDDFEGTRVYAPPEWISKGKYLGIPATIWSLGVLLFDMVNGDIPFHNDSEIVSGAYEYKKECSYECKDLIQKLLTVDEEKRPTFDDILDHPWMQGQKMVNAANEEERQKIIALSNYRFKIALLKQQERCAIVMARQSSITALLEQGTTQHTKKAVAPMEIQKIPTRSELLSKAHDAAAHAITSVTASAMLASTPKLVFGHPQIPVKKNSLSAAESDDEDVPIPKINGRMQQTIKNLANLKAFCDSEPKVEITAPVTPTAPVFAVPVVPKKIEKETKAHSTTNESTTAPKKTADNLKAVCSSALSSANSSGYGTSATASPHDSTNALGSS